MIKKMRDRWYQIGHFFSLDELASTKAEDHTIFDLPNEGGTGELLCLN
jgi:hypothetical protein